jgi:hypothetical protein
MNVVMRETEMLKPVHGSLDISRSGLCKTHMDGSSHDDNALTFIISC